MNTPSGASISMMPSTMACTSSIWAKQLAAVMTLRRRHAWPSPRAPPPCRNSAGSSGCRARWRSSTRRSARCRGCGGRPSGNSRSACRRWSRCRRRDRLRPRPSIFGDFGVELGEIVAQQLGHAAGVGIFRREDDHRIDRKAELHQLAIAAIAAAWSETTAAGAAPGRPAPSGSPAACSRATARSRAAHGRRPGSLRPERWRRCRRHGRLLLGPIAMISLKPVMQRSGFRRKLSLAQYQSSVGGRPFAQRHLRLIAEPGQLRMSGQRRSVPPARRLRRAPTRSRGRHGRRCAAPDRRW